MVRVLSPRQFSEQLRGCVMLANSKLGQRGQRELRPEQRHRFALLEVAAEPAQRRPLELRRLIRCVEEDELEGLLEAERELPGSRLRDDHIAARDGPAELHPWMPLCGHDPPGWGRTAASP